MKELIRIFFVSVLCFASQLHAAPIANQNYYRVNIQDMGPTKLATTKQLPEITWWMELGDELLIQAQPAITTHGLNLQKLPTVPDDAHPKYVVMAAHRLVLPWDLVDTLAQKSRFAIVQARSPEGIHIADADFRVLPFQPNQVLIRQIANDDQPRPSISFRDNTSDAVNMIDKDRWFQNVETLAQWNRYARGNEILHATDWLAEKFRATGAQVDLQEFSVSSTKAYNVIATFTGSESPDEIIVVGAHYDSISEAPGQAAPGAEDNGSGTAALLEVAQVLQRFPPRKTVVVIAFSGEEAGLYGSYAYVQKLKDQSQTGKIKAAITMDMIGFDQSGRVGCLLETGKQFKSLSDMLLAAAQQYTTMDMHTTFNYFGSDHVPFIDNGIPGILTIDNDWDNYDDYHRTTDLPKNISKDMGWQIMKMNVATIMQLAG